MSGGVGPVGRALLDVRAAGPWAPVRAASELAQRVGALEVLRAGVARRPAPLRADCGLLLPPVPVSEVAATRALEAAADVASGHVTIFGTRLEVGRAPDWHALLHAPGHWPLERAHRLALRGRGLAGDPKWAWELARHRHLVLLARAVHLRPEEAHWHDALVTQLRSWLDAAPPGRGIHWTSGLELSLRAVAWAQILGLAGRRLPDDVRARMGEHLWRAAWHLVVGLPGVRAGMPNNHLLAETLGLDLVLRLVEPTPTTRRLGTLARRGFARQLVREYDLAGDGTPGRGGATIEDSVGYDRFVLELVLVRALLDRAEGHPDDDLVHTCLRVGADHLARLGAATPPLPRFGDADEGRALATADASDDLVGTLRAVAGVLGTGASSADRDAHDEAAWYAPVGTPAALPPATADGADTGGGIGRAAVGPFRVWLKGDGGGWHGHGDLGSVALAVEGRWIVADPGTGSYNPDPALRRAAQASASHSALTLEREDQRAPYRTFRFRHAPRGRIGAPHRLGEEVLTWCQHDAYVRLAPPRRVARLVLLGPGGLHVVEVVEGDAPVDWSFRLTVPPPATVVGSRIQVDARSLHLAAPPGSQVTVGGTEAAGAWWSPRYGTTEPAGVVTVRGRDRGAWCWSLVEGEPTWHPTPTGATDGVRELIVVWLHDGVRVDVH